MHTNYSENVTVILDDKDCENKIRTSHYTKDWRCAVNSQGHSVSCKGDEGAPLFVPMQHSDKTIPQYSVIGVYSQTDACDKRYDGKPGIYTKVENFLDWINKNSPKNGRDDLWDLM